MARHYVLADRMFASNLDGSFIAHQYVVAAYAEPCRGLSVRRVGMRGRRDATRFLRCCRIATYGPAFARASIIATLGVEADKAGVSWRFYAGAINGNGGIWSSYQADSASTTGRTGTPNVISPSARFSRTSVADRLANITWITPTWETSDHPGLNGTKGPAWVTASSTRSARASSGARPQSSSSGTTGAGGSIRCKPVARGLRRPRISRAR